MFFNNSITDPHIRYSYTTCGYVDVFTDSREAFLADLLEAANRQPNGRLRVAFPGDSVTMYTAVGQRPYPEGSRKVPIGGGVGGSNRSGAPLVFLDNIMRELGVKWEEAPISDRSHEYSPTSSYTACVHEVAIENVDMCWGAFTPTASRLQLASFSTAFYIDHFVLVVPRSGGAESFGEQFRIAIQRPFAPFTGALWALVFVVLGVVGVLMVLETRPPGSKRLVPVELISLMSISVFRGWHAFSTGEVRALTVTTSGGWLTQFTLGFTKTVLVAGYTSVVTSSLLVPQLTRVDSLEDAINSGYRICVFDQMIERIGTEHAWAARLLVPRPNPAVLSGIDDGTCDAAIVTEDQWIGANLWHDTHHCTTKVRLKQTVGTNLISIPVRETLAPAVSWAITDAVEKGLYVPLVAEARTNYTYGMCRAAISDDPPRLTLLGIAEMGAPLVLCLVVAVVSLALTRAGNRLQSTSAVVVNAIDADGDGSISCGEVRATATRSIARAATSRKGTNVDTPAGAPAPAPAD